MFATKGNSQELVITPKLHKPTALQKAAARITIISVLSQQVNTKSPLLRSDRAPVKLPRIHEPRLQETAVMSSTNILPARRDVLLPSVSEGSNENLEDGSSENTGCNGINGDVVEDVEDGESINQCTNNSEKDFEVSKNVLNGDEKHGSNDAKDSDPFGYMKERKLSEPVLSPRKRTSVISPKLTRCRSTVDLRDKEQPVILRELGGYKFLAKPNETIVSTSNRKPLYNGRVNENKTTSEVSSLKKTIAEQKENITSREKHLLQLEKKLSLLEHENSKNKKQILSFREKLKDCSGTVDYLRREKELLASERDRLSFTLLTTEHELKELRAQNINLVTEYESAEHSRRIAIGHLHEAERVCQESHQDKQDPALKRAMESSTTNSKKVIAQINFILKDAIQKLRNDGEALKNEHNRIGSFFAENFKILVDQVQGIEMHRNESLGNNLRTDPVPHSPHEVLPFEKAAPDEDVFEDPTTESEGVSELDVFKKKLNSNEKRIDDLANQIRELENCKKSLLETRFAMIQEFQAGQAGREVVGVWGADMSGNDTEEKDESVTLGGDRKRSRVTKKIRKLERTLSMDHGVGKLDCIQKLCKKLEDCEQRIHELEATNSELRAEHEDMEEEAKYLKYVLSYRGDVMKAQLQNEYETKMAAMKEELRLAKSNSFDASRSDVAGLTKRNRALEEEVQRLHEELSTLLQNLPALQAVQLSSSRSSECESENSTNLADVSTNLDISKNGDNISEKAPDVSNDITKTYESAADESGDSLGISVNSRNEDDNSSKDADNSQKLGDNAVRNLEVKVTQLMEEKRVLLLSIQTLTNQLASRETGSENESTFLGNVSALEQENTCLSQTLQRIRDVLEDERELENEAGQEGMILKLKDEIRRLDEKLEVSGCRSLTFQEGNLQANGPPGFARHEERIAELEMEVYRLHEEKKSLLSSIVRLQTDPNFTLSDDINDSDIMSSSDALGDDVINGVEINSLEVINETAQRPVMKNTAVNAAGSDGTTVGKDDVAKMHGPLVKTASVDEEVQVNISREGIYGLLGYLQRDLDKLRTAFDQEGIGGNKAEKESTSTHDMTTCPRQNSVQEVQELNKELKDLGQQAHVLEERLQESESIRCDLHRTISIATDMASEERQKCEELTRTKAALEKEMLKLAKENRDLREGLETLSRARKRRSSRAHRVDPSSDTHEDDGCKLLYVPRAKAHNFSESEFSDLDSPVVESKSFSRT